MSKQARQKQRRKKRKLLRNQTFTPIRKEDNGKSDSNEANKYTKKEGG